MMMPEKQIVTLKNKQGLFLHGILHIPDSRKEIKQKIGINLLNPGLKNRIAPNRLYVKIADDLSRQGYYVLRMDPTGIGDSEGNLPQNPIVDIWGQIQQGLFVNDTLAMNLFFIKNCKLDELVLAGSCGGAINALLTAEIDKSVKKLILIDVPVTLSSSKTISDDYLRILEADGNYRKYISHYYLKSVVNPKKWLRFFMLKSDYRAITKLIMLKIKEIRSAKSEGNEPTDSFVLDNLNPHFLRAFKRVCEFKRDILFLCAEKDPDTQLFDRGFRNVYLLPGNPYENRYSISIIEDANHIYTLKASQDLLMENISSWLESHSCK